ncbi:MAG: CHASE2 domain protein [Candidatus Udaeobacter sp.]|jgi:adenylate cyclase|nr:MAG: CHASE2 domain protein [Candidatus Udaeobacter sp.]
MQTRQVKHLIRASAIAGGVLAATTLGLACLRYSFAEPLVRLSYDLPFLWRTTLDTHEIVLVYLDEYSAKQLDQPLDDVWNRALHVRLLDRLTQEKARLVFYDIVFDAPAPDPAADAAFAESIRRHGKVILGAALDIVERLGSVREERVSAPTKLLRKAAAGYGILAFRPVDPDYGVREMYLKGTSIVPTATWRAAEVLGAKVTHDPRGAIGPDWINYYGPPDSFSSVNIAQALDADGVPPGYFKDRIVMVGPRSAVGYLGVGKDEFRTPYSRWNRGFSPGPEIHATILLNLLRSDWLTRMPLNRETALIMFIGLVAGGLAFFRPLVAALIAVIISIGIVCGACWLVWDHRTWFAWVVPAAVQMPLGLAWAVGSQYLLESRRRKELRTAFGFYLSPQMADKIANSDFDLRPGGEIVEATIIFTDLENFTTLSEDLDPTEVSAILIAYFEQTTRCILEKRGTIIKYVGDAVMAAWGAPVDEPAHAICAAEAACDLRALTEIEVRGRKLRTRIGINTGKVLAGNLGSSFRFDYTMIGDATNFASRLESLNKYLGTQILISEAVREQLEDKFNTRRLGEFRVVGKAHSVIIHELLGRGEAHSGERAWIEAFEAGLDNFRAGQFSDAADLMNRACQLRGGSDGPAEFYLRKIAIIRGQDVKTWNGIIELSEK